MKSLVVFSVLLGCLLVCWGCNRGNEGSKTANVQDKANARYLQKVGIFDAQDYARAKSISDANQAREGIPDADLNFLLALLSKSSDHKEASDPQVLAKIGSAKSLTPAQNTKVYEATLNVLQNPIPADTLHQRLNMAINILGATGNKNALPHLKNHTKDVDEQTRVVAERAMRQIEEGTAKWVKRS